MGVAAKRGIDAVEVDDALDGRQCDLSLRRARSLRPARRPSRAQPRPAPLDRPRSSSCGAVGRDQGHVGGVASQEDRFGGAALAGADDRRPSCRSPHSRRRSGNSGSARAPARRHGASSSIGGRRLVTPVASSTDRARHRPEPYSASNRPSSSLFDPGHLPVLDPRAVSRACSLHPLEQVLAVDPSG